MATPRQLDLYNRTKSVCQKLKIPQMTLLHRTLQGTVDSSGRNPVYREPGARTAQTFSPANGTLVWCVRQTAPVHAASGFRSDTQAGEEWTTRSFAQIPAIDDNGNVVAIQEDDILQSTAFNNVRYRIEQPELSEDESFWNFTIRMQR